MSSSDTNQAQPEAPEVPSNDSSTLAKLVSTVANLEATVAGSLQTAAANIKQSVEMMSMFNQMMEAYLIKSIVISIQPGRVESSSDKMWFRFNIRVENIGAADAARVEVDPGDFSTLPSSENIIIPCFFEVPSSLSNIEIRCVASFLSPGSGNTLKVSAQRQIPQIELLRLSLEKARSDGALLAQRRVSFSVKIDALKLRKLFKVPQSRGLAEFEYHFDGDAAVAFVEEQSSPLLSELDDKIMLHVHSSHPNALRDALTHLE